MLELDMIICHKWGRVHLPLPLITPNIKAHLTVILSKAEPPRRSSTTRRRKTIKTVTRLLPGSSWLLSPVMIDNNKHQTLISYKHA